MTASESGALFAEEGYRNTSMREVAAASGILAGSLYHHFPYKEAIAVELVEEYHADLVRVVRESEPSGPDPVANLRAFARDIAEVSHRHRPGLHLSWYEAGAIDDQIDAVVLRAGDLGPSRIARRRSSSTAWPRRGRTCPGPSARASQRPNALSPRPALEKGRGSAPARAAQHDPGRGALPVRAARSRAHHDAGHRRRGGHRGLLEAYRDMLGAGSSVVETLEATCWLLDQAGRHFSREIEILRGRTRTHRDPAARLLGLIALRAYLLLAAAVVIVKVAQLI